MAGCYSSGGAQQLSRRLFAAQWQRVIDGRTLACRDLTSNCRTAEAALHAHSLFALGNAERPGVVGDLHVDLIRLLSATSRHPFGEFHCLSCQAP